MKVRYFLCGLLVALWGFLGYVPVWASSSSGVSVTVPASVGVVFEEDGSCSIPEVSVINGSLVPVRLEGVSVGSRSGWSLVSSGSSIPLDSKKISLSILGVDIVEGFNPLSLDVLEGSSEVIDFSIGRGAWSEGIGVEDAFSLSFRYSLGKKDFTVSFDSAGGGVVSSVVDKNGSCIVLPDCIREGYTFEGWLDSDGVLYQPNENYIVPIGGSSLTAKWRVNRYTIYFDGNYGDSGSVPSINVAYDEVVNLPSNSFVKNAHSFTGWNSNKYGTGTDYAEGGSVSGLSSIDGGSVTLYAQWIPNQATVTINPNNGEPSSSVTGVLGDMIDLSIPSKNGYSFDGWEKSAYYGMFGNYVYENDFSNGQLNGVVAYKVHNGNLNFTEGSVNLVSASSDNPVGSSYELEVNSLSPYYASSLGHVTYTGFQNGDVGVVYKPNTSYVHTFVAKLPKGVELKHCNNSLGTGGKITWYTERYGTGEWETYSYLAQLGSNIHPNPMGYIYINSIDDNAVSSPFSWRVAFTKIMEVTNNPKSSMHLVGSGSNSLTATWRDSREILIYEPNGGRLDSEVNNSEGYKIIPNGIYGIQSTYVEQRYVHMRNADTVNGTPIVIHSGIPLVSEANRGTQAKFVFERYKDTPYYLVQNVLSGKMLELGGDYSSGAVHSSSQVQQWRELDIEENLDFLWALVDNGDGSVKLKNVATGRVIGIPNGTQTENTVLVQQTQDPSNQYQNWKLLDMEVSDYPYRTKLVGSTILVNFVAPVKDGYAFVGWNTKKDGSGTMYQPGDEFPIAMNGGADYLYAQWKTDVVANYQVNHYLQNVSGVGYKLQETESKSGSIYKPLVLSKLAKGYDGFTYDRSEVNGSVVESTQVLENGSRVINLYYSRNSYDVKFDFNLVTKSYVDEFYNDLSLWRLSTDCSVGVVSVKSDNSTEDGYCVEYTTNTLSSGINAGFWFATNSFIPLTPGKTYTYSVKVKANKNLTTARFGFEQGGYVDSGVGINWTTITRTFVANDNLNKNFVFYVNPNQLSVGDKLYVADFRFMEGSPEVITQSKPFESELGTLPNPSNVAGYSFNGWYDSRFGGSPVSPSKKVPLNGLTCFGYWSPSNVNYTVNHYLMNLDGTTYSLDSSESKSSPSNKVLDLSNLAKTFTGFTFLEGKIGGSVKSYTNVLPDGSRVIDLYYSRNQYKLDVNSYIDGKYSKNMNGAGTFDLTINGVKQTGLDDYCSPLYYGSTYEVSNIRLNPGYVFEGYKDNLVTSYGFYDGSPSGVIGHSDELVCCVAPMFSTIDYSISYDLAGGSLSSPINTYKVTTNDFTLPTPSRTGYTFLGWTGSNGSTPQKTVTIPKGSTGNKSYTANWQINNYTIDLDYYLNGEHFASGGADYFRCDIYVNGSLVGSNKGDYCIEHPYQSTIEFKNVQPRPGYKIVGWSTNDSPSIKPMSAPMKIDVDGSGYLYKKIYLHVESINYTVQYKGNGATSGSMGTTSVKYGINTPLATNKFVKDGYQFVGWTAKRKSDGKILYANPDDANANKWFIEGQQSDGWEKYVYKDKEGISKTTGVDNDVITMTAVWEKLMGTVNIRFEFDDGSPVPSAIAPSAGRVKVYANSKRVAYLVPSFTGSFEYGTRMESILVKGASFLNVAI